MSTCDKPSTNLERVHSQTNIYVIDRQQLQFWGNSFCLTTINWVQLKNSALHHHHAPLHVIRHSGGNIEEKMLHGRASDRITFCKSLQTNPSWHFLSFFNYQIDWILRCKMKCVQLLSRCMHFSSKYFQIRIICKIV